MKSGILRKTRQTMLNPAILSIQSTCRRLCSAFVLLGCIFISIALTPRVQAQEAANDPVTNVEVGSTIVWRDAVTRGYVTVTCTDAKGNPVPNAQVSISIGYPGTIVSPPNGDGTTDNSGNVQVTVKSTDFTAEFQDLLAVLTATSEGVNGTSIVQFRGPLQILVNGPSDTGATTPCNVGELQSLSATTLSDVNIGYIYFTASGATPISGWDGGSSPDFTTTTLFPPDSKSRSTAQLYLTTTGSDTTTVTATDTDATGASVATGTANTSFTVSAPTDFAFSASQASPAIGTDVLSLGSDAAKGITNGTLGISFTGSGGSGGTLSFAQILNTNDVTITDKYGAGSLHPVVKNQDGLDAAYPYPINAGTNTTNDNPSSNQQDISTTDIHYNSFVATMYLMWTSSKLGAIAIPVMSIPWNWNAEATFDPATGKGTLKPNGSSSTTIKGKPVSASMGVLTWTRTWNKPASK